MTATQIASTAEHSIVQAVEPTCAARTFQHQAMRTSL